MENAAADAKTCHDATYGAGTNVAKLASVLCARSPQHLNEVSAAFKSQFNKDLRSVVEKETSGNIEKILTAGLRDASDTRALILHSAVSGAGTNEGALIDVILTLTPEEMKALNDTWTKRFGIPIMARIMIDGVLAGSFHYLLEQVTCGNKPGGPVNHDVVVGDCKLLVGAGEGKVGTAEKEIAKLFSTRSREHLIFLNEEYKKHSPKKQSLEQAMRSETSGALEQALVCCLQRPEEYFADRFHQSMKGIGTKEDDLVNAILLSQGHLKGAVAAYEQKYSKKFVPEVEKELSGDLEKALVAYLKFHLQ